MKKKLTLPDLNMATHWINRRPDHDILFGKPLLIHFWSVSCSHCRQSLPTIRTLCERFADRLNIIAIHMPLSENDLDVEAVARTCALLQINEPVLIDNRHRLADAFANRYVPAYYLFDRRGELLEYHMGERGAQRIGRAAERLFQLPE